MIPTGIRTKAKAPALAIAMIQVQGVEEAFASVSFLLELVGIGML
jgi:hypothetical protein